MTKEEKQKVLDLRNQGMTYGEIAWATGIKRPTIVAMCQRTEKKIKKEAEAVLCLNCGEKIPKRKGCGRKAKFCCDECRLEWWGGT